jgi:bifunctional DNase/RNase
MSAQRVIVLKEVGAERYLPIWIGHYEAEAIAIQLKNIEIARPLTHDLLKSVITEMGGNVLHILVKELRDDTFYAHISVNLNGKELEIDSRPSDAIALAVRVEVPIYVAEEVMEEAGIIPEEDVDEEADKGLSAFRQFVDNLDLEDLSKQ